MLESIFNKVARLHVCNFIKKRPQHICFLVFSGGIKLEHWPKVGYTSF